MKIILTTILVSIGFTLLLQSVTPPLNYIEPCQTCGNTKFVKCDQTIYTKFPDTEEPVDVKIKHKFMCNHCLTFTEIEAKRD